MQIIIKEIAFNNFNGLRHCGWWINKNIFRQLCKVDEAEVSTDEGTRLIANMTSAVYFFFLSKIIFVCFSQNPKSVLWEQNKGNGLQSKKNKQIQHENKNTRHLTWENKIQQETAAGFHINLWQQPDSNYLRGQKGNHQRQGRWQGTGENHSGAKKGGKTRTGSKVTENTKEDETTTIKEKVPQTRGQLVRDCTAWLLLSLEAVFLWTDIHIWCMCFDLKSNVTGFNHGCSYLTVGWWEGLVDDPAILRLADE